MTTDSLINKYFCDEERAQSYVSNRLLGNYEQAPPAIPPEGSGLQLEPYRTDALIDVALNLEDKSIFWSACLASFEQWRDLDTADEASAAAMYHLVYMITELSERDELPADFEASFQSILGAGELKLRLPTSVAAISVYTSLVTLVDLWQLWGSTNWQYLFDELRTKGSADSERQCALMLTVSKNIDWNEDKTKDFVYWAAGAERCPGNLIRKYYALRLRAGGINGKNGATEGQILFRKDFFKQFLKGIHYAHVSISYDKTKLQRWTFTLKDISQFFKTQSFDVGAPKAELLQKFMYLCLIDLTSRSTKNKKHPTAVLEAVSQAA